MERLELTILRNLVYNEDYSRKVIPFIQPDYFEEKTERIVFEEVTKLKFSIKKSAYLKYPSKDKFTIIPKINIDFFENDLFNPFLFSSLLFAKLFPTT